ATISSECYRFEKTCRCAAQSRLTIRADALASGELFGLRARCHPAVIPQRQARMSLAALRMTGRGSVVQSASCPLPWRRRSRRQPLGTTHGCAGKFFLNLRKIIFAALLWGVSFTAFGASWWNTDWKYRKEIDFDLSPTGADVAGTAQNVPVLVRLSVG